MKVSGETSTYESVHVKMLEFRGITKVRTEIKEATAQRLHADIVHLMNLVSIE